MCVCVPSKGRLYKLTLGHSLKPGLDETELTEDSLVSRPFWYKARQKIATPEEGVVACELQ